MPELQDSDWDELAERLDALSASWAAAVEDGGPEPELTPFLEGTSDALRPRLLEELVKLDLDQRREHGRAVQFEAYGAAFPELGWQDGPPAEVLLEWVVGLPEAERAAAHAGLVEAFPQRAAGLERWTALLPTQGAAPALAWPEEGDVLDEFLLIQEVGRGAFARVYLARQRSMQRMVALKVSAEQGGEAATLAQLDHPHIVRVFDQRDLSSEGRHLLYMEIVAGGSLQAYIAARRLGGGGGAALLAGVDAHVRSLGAEIPTDSALRHEIALMDRYEVACLVGLHVAQGLAHAHAQGVLHRDLKPANILLSAEGRAKLADFNISYAARVEGADPGATLGGSLAYMAPEQMEAIHPSHARTAGELDGRADLYALGVLLYEMVVGERPFDDTPDASGFEATLSSMLAARAEGVSEAARGAWPKDAPVLLAPTVLGLLEPARHDRPRGAEDVAHRLDLALDGEAMALLAEPEDLVHRAVRARPRFMLLLLAILPNVILSALNIAYNLDALIRETGVARFKTQVTLVNAVAFGVGILALIAWLRPLRAGSSADDPHRLRRLLGAGRVVVAITLPLWILGGLAFPIWQHVEAGAPSGSAYLHFAVSNALFGFMAAASALLLVTAVSQRALLAEALLEREAVGPRSAAVRRELARQGPHARIAFEVYMAVPFLSVILLAASSLSPNRAAFLGLGLLGLVFLWPMMRLTNRVAHRAAILTRIASTDTLTESP